MIVVDANVVAHLLLPVTFTASAKRLLESDPAWAAPRLWRSELRHMLATCARSGQIELHDALDLFQRASGVIDRDEYEVDTPAVLRLCRTGGCSAYDCKYVALAEFLDLEFVTADKALAKALPGRARLLLPWCAVPDRRARPELRPREPAHRARAGAAEARPAASMNDGV